MVSDEFIKVIDEWAKKLGVMEDLGIPCSNQGGSDEKFRQV